MTGIGVEKEARVKANNLFVTVRRDDEASAEMGCVVYECTNTGKRYRRDELEFFLDE